MAPHSRAFSACILWCVTVCTVASSYATIFKRYDVQPFNLTESEMLAFDPEVRASDISKCEFSSDCRDIRNCDHRKSGTYRIFPFGFGKGFRVYCDMATDGGGWLVFQRRHDGSVDFYRNWQSYKDGFGNLYGEFWLGLDKIHLLTNLEEYELMVVLGGFDGKTGYAKYKRFRVADEAQQYRLLVEDYTGTVGNGMAHQNGMKFSSLDRDNDNHKSVSCSRSYLGAWWYNACHRSNLNGFYLQRGESRGTKSVAAVVAWYEWKGKHEALQFSEMKIRPLSN